MAIPTEIETVLTAALAEKPDVLAFVKGLDAKAEKLTPDVEKALPDLAKLPELQASAAALAKVLGDTKAKDADALVKDFNSIKTIKEDLEKQRNDWKKAGGAGSGAADPKDSPEYKALEELLNTKTAELGTQIKTLQDESKASKDAAVAAAAAKLETDLKSSVISAAAKHKIRDAEDEFLLLRAKGLIGYKDEAGKQVPFYHKLNDKGEKVAVASADELLKHIAETNKNKVDASGRGGAGASHGGTGVVGTAAPTTAKDARSAFLQR